MLINFILFDFQEKKWRIEFLKKYIFLFYYFHLFFVKKKKIIKLRLLRLNICLRVYLPSAVFYFFSPSFSKRVSFDETNRTVSQLTSHLFSFRFKTWKIPFKRQNFCRNPTNHRKAD